MGRNRIWPGGRYSAVRWWLRTHRIWAVAVTQLGVAVVCAVWGGLEMSVPADTPQGSVNVALWVFLPVVAAIAIAIGMTGDMASFEERAARCLLGVEFGYLGAGLAVTALVLGVAAYLGGVGDVVPELLRNLVLWLGLALLSGRILGRSLAWVAPLTVVVPLDYFGYDARTQPHGWAIPLREFDAVTATVAVLVLGFGLGATALTRWHGYAVRRAADRYAPRTRGD